MRLLCYLLIVEIGMSSIACADFKTRSITDCFMGVEMKLPQDSVVKLDDKNKTIVLLKGENLSADLEKDERFKSLQSANQYPEIALAFLCATHELFELVDPPDELSVKSLQTDDLGYTHIKFMQSYKGIPVWASEINFHLNQQNHVYLIQGRYIPTPINVNTKPDLTEKDALGIVTEKLGKDRSECPGCSCETIIFEDAADSNTAPCLAYRIETKPGPAVGWEFIIDADSGTVLKKLSAVFNDKSKTGRMKMIPKK
jgi:Zn-dependent metalloprotease